MDLPDTARRVAPGTWRFRLDAGNALFAGHFPGDPVLPGIAHLGLVLAAWRRERGSEMVIVALGDVRFLRPVRPDEDIEVEVSEVAPFGAGAHDVRFRLRSGGEEASRGVVRVGA